jgi:hypothetical protein
MAHYALLDENNVVVNVITGKDEDETVDGIVIDWEAHYSNTTGFTCKRTSYNTSNGIHIYGGTPFRGTYAGIGFHYVPEYDVFTCSLPPASWTFNQETSGWDAPTPYPDDDKQYDWDEESLSWIEITG